jgi:hypothetical protein
VIPKFQDSYVLRRPQAPRPPCSGGRSWSQSYRRGRPMLVARDVRYLFRGQDTGPDRGGECDARATDSVSRESPTLSRST